MRLREISVHSYSSNRLLYETDFTRRSFLRGVAGLASMGIKPMKALSNIFDFRALADPLPKANKELLNKFLFMLYNDVDIGKVTDFRNFDFRPEIKLSNDRDGRLSYYANGVKLDNYMPSQQKEIAFSGFYTRDGMLYVDKLGDGNFKEVAPVEAIIGYLLRNNSQMKDGFKTTDLFTLLDNLPAEIIEKIAPGLLDDIVSQIVKSQGVEDLLNAMKDHIWNIDSVGECPGLLKSSRVFRAILDVPENFDTVTMTKKLLQHGVIDQGHAQNWVDWVNKYGDRINQKIDLGQLEAEKRKSDELKRRFTKENEAKIEKEKLDRERYKAEKEAEKEAEERRKEAEERRKEAEERRKEAEERRKEENLKYDEYLQSQMSWESGIGESKTRSSKWILYHQLYLQ